MFITTIEQMESIVSREKNLSWESWTVLERIPSNKGMSSKDGVLVNGKWHIQKRFEPTRDGWKIPKKYVR